MDILKRAVSHNALNSARKNKSTVRTVKTWISTFKKKIDAIDSKEHHEDGFPKNWIRKETNPVKLGDTRYEFGVRVLDGNKPLVLIIAEEINPRTGKSELVDKKTIPSENIDTARADLKELYQKISDGEDPLCSQIVSQLEENGHFNDLEVQA
jgi:hypothetical protein